MLLGLIISLAIFLFLVFTAPTFYQVSSEMGSKAIRWFGYILATLSAAFFVYTLYWGIRRSRFNLFIINEELILQDIFTAQKSHFKIGKVKGFSTSDIHSKFSQFHVVIIYFDSRTQDFTKLILRNFHELKKALQISGIKYIGHEPYSLTWYGKRKYKYLWAFYNSFTPAANKMV